MASFSFSLTLYVEDSLMSQSNQRTRILKANAFLKGGRVIMFFGATLLQVWCASVVPLPDTSANARLACIIGSVGEAWGFISLFCNPVC